MRSKAIEKILPQDAEVGTTPLKDQTVTYTYDNLNRLTMEVGDDDPGSTSHGYTVGYEYDLAGNRLNRSVSFEHSAEQLYTEYVYNEPGQNNERDQLLREIHTGTIPTTMIERPNGPYYAYINDNGVFYTKAGSKVKIGPFKAWLIGLPSSFSHWLFGLVTAMLIVAFLLPAIMHILARIRKREPARMSLSLRNRCISVLLSYLMIVGPAGFEQIAHASTQYSDLGTGSWGTHNRIIEYGEWDGTNGRTGNFTLGYDANGSVTKKITWDTHGPTSDPIDHTKIEEVTYEYNLQNRLAKVTTYDYIIPATTVVAYKYNADGVRIAKIKDPEGSAVTTIYLTDSYNHTGYAQTLEEMTFNALDPDPVNDIPASRKTYTIGDDMLTEATAEHDGTEWTYYAQHLIYDGHGSTRQLVTGSVGSTSIVDDFSYDGYGVLLQDEDNFTPPDGTQVPGKVAPQATSMLYAGEHFDTDSQNYYLRARWYDSLSGRFNRIDPFAGNNQDPQSLHKYLYAHCNPINGIDPSGMFTLTDITSTMKTWAIGIGRMLLPTFTIKMFAFRVIIGSGISASIQLYANYYLKPLINELALLSKSVKSISSTSAMLVDKLSELLGKMYFNITVQNVLRPFTWAQLGLLVNAIKITLTVAPFFDYLEMVEETMPAILNRILGTNISVDVHQWKLVGSVLSFGIDPASDVRLVREIIEAHKTGDLLLETFLVADMIERLKDYNFVSVRLD